MRHSVSSTLIPTGSMIYTPLDLPVLSALSFRPKIAQGTTRSRPRRASTIPKLPSTLHIRFNAHTYSSHLIQVSMDLEAVIRV